MNATRVPRLRPGTADPVPSALVAAMRTATRSGDPMDVATPAGPVVTCYPPTRNRQTWRLYWTDVDGPHFLGGGREAQRLWRAVTVAGARAAAAGRPEALSSVADMVEQYLADQRAKGWTERTFRDRRIDLANLVAVAGQSACVDLDRAHIAAAIQRCGTARRGTFVANRIAHLLAWGYRQSYLTREQSQLHELVAWRAPAGYREPPSRRSAARRAGSHPKAVDRGEVPTPAQVTSWATAMGDHYLHGVGMVHLAAATGLRLGELLACTADPGVAEQGSGNLVDTGTWTVAVRVQAVERGQARTGLPKARKVRDVVVPRADATCTGFDVRSWVAERAKAARAEQSAGANPDALLFPSPRGRLWWQANFSNRVLRPALDGLGWPTTTVTDANNATRTWHRFTWHSLRDRYACTAVDDWGYSEAQLFHQGGWEDIETVRRYYYGIDDDTEASVRALIG